MLGTFHTGGSRGRDRTARRSIGSWCVGSGHTRIGVPLRLRPVAKPYLVGFANRRRCTPTLFPATLGLHLDDLRRPSLQAASVSTHRTRLRQDRRAPSDQRRYQHSRLARGRLVGRRPKHRLQRKHDTDPHARASALSARDRFACEPSQTMIPWYQTLKLFHQRWRCPALGIDGKRTIKSSQPCH